MSTDSRIDILMLHCNVAILMVPDIVLAYAREDLLSLFTPKRVDAESWVMNCLIFGSTNKYTLQLQADPDRTRPDDSSDRHTSITVPLIAIDPYPHHVVAAVKLMHQAIDRDLAAGRLSADAYKNLVTTLVQTLEQLPQCSKSVEAARVQFMSVRRPP